MATPKIQSYHCICTTHLLSSTHILSLLPRRPQSHPSSSSDIILPLPSQPPQSEGNTDLPSSGYTIVTSLVPDRKPTIIRREDGFEKRVLYRCGRCKLVIGYELVVPEGGEGEGEGGDGEGQGVYKGKVLYLLPGGLMSTETMMAGKKIGEEDVGMGGGSVGAFEVVPT